MIDPIMYFIWYVLIFFVVVIGILNIWNRIADRKELEQDQLEKQLEKDKAIVKPDNQYQTIHGQPSKKEFHKVLNFMHQSQIVDTKTYNEIIKKSLPYIM